jgi:hypothetical protein
MRKLNLKDELTNIRNTLKPPSSQNGSGEAGGGRKKIFAILAGIIVVVVGMGWITGVWQSAGLISGISFQREFGKPKKKKNYKKSSSESDLVSQSSKSTQNSDGAAKNGSDKDVNGDNLSKLEDSTLAAPDEQGNNGRGNRTARLADSSEAAPDEEGLAANGGERHNNNKNVKVKKSDGISSRAKGASKTAKSKPVKTTSLNVKPNATRSVTPTRPVAASAKAPKASKVAKEKIYRIRFGLCLYKQSCEEIIRKLKRRNVSATLSRSTTKLLTHKVMVGPWSTKAHAIDASGKIGKQLVKTSILTSNNKFYLLTEVYPDSKKADSIRDKIGSMGYRAERVSKREPRKVYKVFEGAYKNKAGAIKRQKHFADKGFGCIVELDG